MTIFSASLLAANHANIARDVKIAEKNGIEWFHIDVADGLYTHNIIFGDQLVRDLRKETKGVLDVHLATYNLSSLAEQYIDAGADIITFQNETCKHPLRLIRQIRSHGKKASICFAPSTAFTNMDFFIDEVDMINFLTVEPGVGGQTLNKKIIPNIKRAAEIKIKNNLKTLISVDGGINNGNMVELIDAGADILVMGSSIFYGDITTNINRLSKLQLA
ncbi:MAG: ribulose-phosphate 3-epimerase [Eubacteriales bacterium]